MYLIFSIKRFSEIFIYTQKQKDMRAEFELSKGKQNSLGENEHIQQKE